MVDGGVKFYGCGIRAEVTQYLYLFDKIIQYDFCVNDCE
jgi:hypothetical protein